LVYDSNCFNKNLHSVVWYPDRVLFDVSEGLPAAGAIQCRELRVEREIGGKLVSRWLHARRGHHNSEDIIYGMESAPKYSEINVLYSYRR
jgi:hypothetical protein